MLKARALALLTASAVSLTTWLVAPVEASPRPTTSRPAAASAPATAPASRAAAVAWHPCRDPLLRQVGAQCGFVTVPRDYGDPEAGTLRLAVSRVRHTTRRSQGVMLTNPGGPGGPGRWMAALGQLMPAGSGAGYDWIGFDPRGVGASRPRLSCQPRYFHADRPPYRPTTPVILRGWLRRSLGYAQACGAKHGDLLEHMTTEDTVRDMNRIRSALGAPRISFYGYSYGTYLGQVFATLFPDRLHRMVLDSNVDPRHVWYDAGKPQMRAQNRVFRLFFRWVARYHRTYRLGRTAAVVERRYLREQRALVNRPARGVLGPSEFADAFVPALYLELAWPLVADAFAAQARGNDPRPLIRLYRFSDTPGDDNQYAAFNAVTCTDAPWPERATVLADARRMYQVAPLIAWASTWFSGPCMFWPAAASSPVEVEGTDHRFLLVGQTLDGATPFQESVAVRGIFPRSRLVAIRGGSTHGSTPDLSGPCANARLAVYLRRGALPPRRAGAGPDVVCQAPPPPRPAAVGGRGGLRALLGMRMLP
jgi:pimeloyl-ACP methyl ester carboxylesterase